jgi:hypothetical protein
LLVGPDGKISLSRSGITDTTLFPLMASVEVLDSASAKGIKGGIAAVSVSGGMPPYRIEWNNGEKGDTAHALKAGLQKVLVFDANGLKKELALEVPQIAPLYVTLSSDTFPNGKNTSCYNCKDGIIQSLVSGGRAPYSYRWIPGNEDSVSLSARGAGLYVLQVTDITGESSTAWINIAAPERPDWSMVGNAQTDPQNQYIGTSDSTDVVFRTNNIEALRLGANKNIGVGVNDPTAKLDVSGTVRVRENLLVDSLAFTPDQNNPTSLRNLLINSEGKLVLGSGGVTDTVSFPLSASVTLLDSAAATGSKGGEAMVSATGGKSPYKIEWSNGEKSDTAKFLRPGIQKVAVQDANGTKKELVFDVPTIAPLVVKLSADTFTNGKHLSCFNCSDGVISATVTGGRMPYTYRWLPGEIEDSTAIHARAQGLYVLQVIDATGATATAWTNLLAPERPDWQMSGNTGTDPNTQFIGTTDSTDIVFRTNNTEALRLSANKNIGVGVHEPTAKLDVLGTVRVRENLLIDSLAFNVNGLDNSTHRILVVDKDGVVSALPNGLRSDHVPCNCIPCEFEPICNKGSLSTAWKKPAGSGLIGESGCYQYDQYVRTCSMVGIGYNASIYNNQPELPRYQLDVTGTTYTDKLKVGNHFTLNPDANRLEVAGNSSLIGKVVIEGNTFITGNTETIGNVSIELDNDDEFFINDIKPTSANTMRIHVRDGEYKVIKLFNTDLAEDVFYVEPDGTVQIGAVENENYVDSKLKVYGLVSARKFKITLGEFPDYVFDSTYKRLSITELEAYIKQHKHLPGMPSEAEVKTEGGFDVGEVQLSTVEKTEELFLYVIELNKRIARLESELKNCGN